jgi:hypothetical protein
MSRRPVRLPYLFAILSPLILFSPLIFGGEAIFWGTPITQFVPWWSYAWESLRELKLPLWNPYLGMGAPLIGNYQSGIFYPPNWIYFVLDSIGGTPWMAWGQALVVVFHLGLASIGMGLLVRQLGINEFGQTISGLSYGLSGYLVSRAGFLSINSAAAWLPWIILAATKILEGIREDGEHPGLGDPSEQANRGGLLRGARLRNILSLAAFTGLLLLAGHAQVAWYTLVFALLWVIYFSILETKGSGAALSWGIVGLAVAFGVILAAVQLFPTGEYLLESQRASSVDYQSALSYSFWPWHFLNFLSPGIFGSPVSGDYWGYANYWEDAVYIGLGPLILAISAVVLIGASLRFSRPLKKRLIAFLVVVILASFVLALGWYTPLFPWLYRNIPTFDMFQGPARISLLALFSLSILAGMGAERWRRPTGRSLYWSRLGTMGAASMAIGAGLAAIMSSPALSAIEPSLIRSTAFAGFWAFCFGILTLVAPATNPSENVGAIWKPWHWVTCAWVAADLIVANWGIMPGIDRQLYADSPRTAEAAKASLEEGRIYLPESAEKILKFDQFFRFDTFKPFINSTADWYDLREALLPNISLLDRIPSANNFDPLVPGRYNQWLSAFGEADQNTQNQLLNLMGVTILEVLNSDSEPDVEFFSRDAYPRVRWVPCSKTAIDGAAALEMILGGEIDHINEVVIEGEVESLEDCGSNQMALVASRLDQMNEILVDVQSDSPGYLVVADVWYPGWKARVDEQSTQLLRANYLFRGVSVPPGEHTVEIYYHPDWFYRGAILSGAGWISIILLALIPLIRRKLPQ